MSFFHPFRERRLAKKRERQAAIEAKNQKKAASKKTTKGSSLLSADQIDALKHQSGTKQRTTASDLDFDFDAPSADRVPKPLDQDAETNAQLALTNLENVSAKRESIETDIKTIYAHLSEVQNSLKDHLNRESSLIKDQIAYSDSQRRMIDRKSKQIRANIEETKNKLAELDLKKLDDQVTQLQQQKHVSEDDQHNNEVRVSSLQQQIVESKKQRGILQQDISNLEKDKNDLFIQLKSEDKVEVFLEKAEPVRNKISAISDQQDQKAQDIEKLLDREKKMNATVERITKQNQSIQAHVADIDATVEQIGHQRKKWEQEIVDAQAVLKSLTLKLQSTTNMSRSLKQKHEKWSERLATVQQKLLQFTNANVSTSSIDMDHGHYYFYSPDVPKLTKDNRDVIRGYDAFFKQRNITPIILTTAYNEDGQRQLSELKRKANINNAIQLVNMYDDLQGRKTTRIPRHVEFTPDPEWRAAKADNLHQVQYFNANNEVMRVVVYRADDKMIWMINYFETGQLMKRDVFDRDGYLSVTQTFDILDHSQIKEERFYKEDGSVRLVKHYDTFEGNLIDIQLMDDQELLFNVFHSEADFQASWIQQKISESDQSRLILNISYSGFIKLAGSGSANYSLIPILDVMDQDRLKDALNRANLVQTVATDNPKKAQQFQEWFGQRYSIWVIKKPDYDPSDFHIVLPNEKDSSGRTTSQA